ncbi:phosphatidylglycerol lysyltransferase domain-containing protein [Frigidibacter sp. MR17.14]|uniref:phosphatidylglycerol lysyltransferase domain-containing protein n=1 Tax=Frigidibacter sp. MR17.14 TaxID=3126509 RepID=UPI003012BFD3
MRHRVRGLTAAMLATELPLRRIALQQALPVVALGALILVLGGRARALDPVALWQAVAAVELPHWIGAASATLVSFWAVSRYDRMAHALLDTGADPARAGAAGAAAIAVAQTLGFGLLTGTLTRWRMLPELGLKGAFAVTGLASLLFLAGWAAIAAPVWLLLGPETGHDGADLGALAAGLVIALLGGLALASAAGLRLRGRRLPPLGLIVRLLAVAALDLGAAALALWWCLPAGLGAQMLPAMLLAFAAGLVSGTPAGLGAFEAVFLSLLPEQPAEPLIGAILAWRAVYFAGPAVIGAATALLCPPRPARPVLILHPRGTPATDRRAPAEILLGRQGEHRLAECTTARHQWLLAETAQCQVALFDPAPAAFAALQAPLTARARALGRIPVLYRIGPRAAARARTAGWRLLRIGAEAVIAPAAFDPATPAHAGLRRKIAKARKAGVTIERLAPGAPLPLAELAEVAAHWARARGGERGFSTGRFCPDYLAGQQVFLARSGGRILAFASFHGGPREWTLDLMRSGPDLPDGTLQALIVEAIAAARAARIPRLSLAAVSAAADPRAPGPLWALARRLGLGRETAGLAQFKRAFAPDWEPRYLAAPGPVALLVAAVEITRAVHRPEPLGRP